MERVERRDGYDLEEPRGRTSLRTVKPGVVLITFEGMVSERVIAPLRESVATEAGQHGPVGVFFDGSRLDHYSIAMRRLATRWFAERRRDFAETHALVGSAWVERGLHLVNTYSGGKIVGHSHPAPFARALSDALGRHEETVREDPFERTSSAVPPRVPELQRD